MIYNYDNTTRLGKPVQGFIDADGNNYLYPKYQIKQANSDNGVIILTNGDVIRAVAPLRIIYRTIDQE